MNTYDRLVRILANEHKLATETLQPDARLDELGIDSLSVMELLFMIEEEFNIRVPDDRVPLVTIDDMVSYVNNLIAQQADASPHQAAS